MFRRQKDLTKALAFDILMILKTKGKREMEKKISQKSINDKLRNKYIALIKESLEQLEEEILITASNEIAIPCVDNGGNDNFVVIKFSVPTGSRDGEPYDAYAVADEYKAHCEEMEEKAKMAKLAKEKKMAQDKARREKLAQSKSDHTTEK